MAVPLVDHPDSVVIVAVEGDQVLCVRQPRRGPGKETLELPSGKIDPGESPLEAAARELAEECALGADEWQELASFWAVPAYSTEFVYIYEARDLHPAEAVPLDEDEDIEVEHIPLVGSLERLSDAISVAALAIWLEAR
jgi:ADP-ribose pyrophosphatase